METKQIIDGLLDRAERSADLSAGRIMRQAAERLRELDERTKYKPAPELMPMGALTYAIACSHCGNRNKDAETCRKCRCEIESGFEVDPLNGWIPVAERLPKRGADIIVCSHRTIKPVVFTTYFWDEKHDNWLGITHWMPLPEPPKEVE
jgi:hypothetical protein